MLSVSELDVFARCCCCRDDMRLVLPDTTPMALVELVAILNGPLLAFMLVCGAVQYGSPVGMSPFRHNFACRAARRRLKPARH